MVAIGVMAHHPEIGRRVDRRISHFVQFLCSNVQLRHVLFHLGLFPLVRQGPSFTGHTHCNTPRSMVFEASPGGATTEAAAAGAVPGAADRANADSAEVAITRLHTPADLRHHTPALRLLLQSLVNLDPPTSSIGFHAPLSDAGADAYWASVAEKMAPPPEGQLEPAVYMFIATSTQAAGSAAARTDGTGAALTSPPLPSDPDVLATVQLVPILKPTHRHRAEVAKLLVHPSMQGKGLGRSLMSFVEEFARSELGKEVLTLDTATETPARGFYRHIGWAEWGTCPDYADYADGRRTSATFFVKMLR